MVQSRWTICYSCSGDDLHRLGLVCDVLEIDGEGEEMILIMIGIWLACSVLNFAGLVILYRTALKYTSLEVTKEKHNVAIKNIRLYTLLGPIGTVMLIFSLALVLIDELISLTVKLGK